MPTIIDTHTHLYDVPDADDALRLSAEAGVSDIVMLGVDYPSNVKHLELASRQNLPLRVHLAWGLHPGNITPEDAEKCFPFFREHIHQAVAIGETGLDFWYKWVRNDDAKKDEQRLVFEQHLDLAEEFGLPVVIHSRGTWRECLERSVHHGIKKAVFHWYNGPLDVMKDILDAGYFVSISPAIEYSDESRRTAEHAPLDRILVETDTPIKVSNPSGERVPSIPKDVWRTFKALCAVKGLDEAAALEAVNANARAFFSLKAS